MTLRASGSPDAYALTPLRSSKQLPPCCLKSMLACRLHEFDLVAYVHALVTGLAFALSARWQVMWMALQPNYYSKQSFWYSCISVQVYLSLSLSLSLPPSLPPSPFLPSQIPPSSLPQHRNLLGTQSHVLESHSCFQSAWTQQDL